MRGFHLGEGCYAWSAITHGSLFRRDWSNCARPCDGAALYASSSGAGPWFSSSGLLALFGSSHLSIAVVNWIATLFAKPTPLPSMDFSEGIPGDCRTMIAIPAMLTSSTGVSDLVEALEVRYWQTAMIISTSPC